MKKIKVKHIFFDFSGTLSDDLDKVVSANNRTRKKFGLKKITKNEFREEANVSFQKFFIELGVKDPTSSYIESYEESPKKVSLIPGAKVTLRRAKEKGIINSIISAHPVKLLQKEIHEYRIGMYINYFQAGVVNKYEAIMKMMGKLGAKPREVLVVDDTTYGIKAGKTAEAYTAAVITRYSYQRRKKLESANPDFRLYRILDLLKILD